jgi:hypothetical protein
MRLMLWILVVLNLAVALVALSDGERRRLGAAGPSTELAPERIRLLTDAQVRERRASDQRLPCIEWGPFSEAQLQGAERLAASLDPELKLGEPRREPGPGWQVLIPPAASRRAAEARGLQLKQAGILDATVVQDDPQWRNGIDLGSFADENTAQRRRDELLRQGVGDAQTVPRDAGVPRVFLQLLGVSQVALGRLTADQGPFPGSVTRACR